MFAATIPQGRGIYRVALRTIVSISVSALGVALAALFLFAPPKSIHKESSQLEVGQVAHERQAPDIWAGKPVMGTEHVTAMVNGRMKNAPKLGELAPDFSLVDARTGEVANLRQLCSEKPAVLFFASYSCHVSHDSAESLSQLALRYQRVANFFLIYIQEAHPEGGFPPILASANFVIPAPVDFAQRVAAAQRLGDEERFSFPILVDSLGDSTNARWAAWPVRLYVVDRQGTVIYAGQHGPWFFKPTRTYDPKVPNIPEGLRNAPGFSKESLEEFLEILAARESGAPKTS